MAARAKQLSIHPRRETLTERKLRPSFCRRRSCRPHQSRTRNDRAEIRRTRSNRSENVAKSTKLKDVPPLITVWLQVRVLPRSLRELRLGKPAQVPPKRSERNWRSRRTKRTTGDLQFIIE